MFMHHLQQFRPLDVRKTHEEFQQMLLLNVHASWFMGEEDVTKTPRFYPSTMHWQRQMLKAALLVGAMISTLTASLSAW